MDISVSQRVAGSASYQLTSQWKLLGSFGWRDWREVGDIGVAVDTSLGSASTQASPKLRWNLGAGCDSSMVDDDRTVGNPTGDSWRLATSGMKAWI